MKLNMFILSGLCLGLLAGCGNDTLSRKEALKQLQARYASGTESVTFKLCPVEKRMHVYEVDPYGYGTHPCQQFPKINGRKSRFGGFTDNYEKLLVTDYGIFKRNKLKITAKSGKHILSRDFLTVYSLSNPKVISKIGAENYLQMNDTSDVVNVKMYDYKLTEVTGIRQRADDVSDMKEGCDAIVEYTYDRFNFAPWGQDYVTQIKKPRTSYSACFQKFDDGWRLKAK